MNDMQPSLLMQQHFAAASLYAKDVRFPETYKPNKMFILKSADPA